MYGAYIGRDTSSTGTQLAHFGVYIDNVSAGTTFPRSIHSNDAAGRMVHYGPAVFGSNSYNGVETCAQLTVTSTTRGLLLPRMTKTQRDAISSKVAGLAVYQTDNTPGLRVWNGTNWMRYTETAD